MKHSLVRVGAVAAAVLLAAACGGGSDEAPASTSSTTTDLLSQPPTDGNSTPVAVDPALVREGERIPVADIGFDRGDSLAIVKVVELSDFGCGYCKRFHDQTFPTLREQFIETGMVEWKFVPFVTGMFDNSLAVTEAAECVLEQSADSYVAFTERLWSEQSTWKQSGDPSSLAAEWARDAGAETDTYASCMDEDRRLRHVASSTTLARQVGVRGTPTFVVIGYPPLQGALPLEIFQEMLTLVHKMETDRRAEAAETPGPVGDSGP